MQNNRILIIHVVTRLYLGGAQRVSLQILNAMKDKGYSTLLITGPSEEMSADFAEAGIKMLTIPSLNRCVNPLNDLLAFISLYTSFKRLKSRYKEIIVHTHTTKSGILGRLAAKAAGIEKIYHTAHGWSFHEEQNRISFWISVLCEAFAAKATKKIIAVSEYVMKSGLDNSIGNSSQYVKILNGIRDCRKLSPEESKKTRVSLKVGDEKIVMQVSCLKPQKAPIDFLRVADFLKDENIKFIIAGDGELRGKMENWIEQRNLRNVVMTGWHRNVDELYSIADCFVLTSVFEGLPLVLMEYKQYEKPVICTSIQPNREVSERFKFCEPHDIECFAKNIRFVLNNESHGISYGITHTVEDMVNEYENVYRR